MHKGVALSFSPSLSDGPPTRGCDTPPAAEQQIGNKEEDEDESSGTELGTA